MFRSAVPGSLSRGGFLEVVVVAVVVTFYHNAVVPQLAAAQYSCIDGLANSGRHGSIPTVFIKNCTFDDVTGLSGPGLFDISGASSGIGEEFTFTMVASVLTKIGFSNTNQVEIQGFIDTKFLNSERRLYVNITNNTFTDVVIRIVGLIPQESRIDIFNNRFSSALIPRGATLDLFVLQLEAVALHNMTALHIQHNVMAVGHEASLIRKNIIWFYNAFSLRNRSECLIQGNSMMFSRERASISTAGPPGLPPDATFITHDGTTAIQVLSGSVYSIRHNTMFVDLPIHNRRMIAEEMNSFTAAGASHMVTFQAGIECSNDFSTIRIESNRFYSYVSIQGTYDMSKAPVIIAGTDSGRSSYFVEVVENASIIIAQNTFFFDVVVDNENIYIGRLVPLAWTERIVIVAGLGTGDISFKTGGALVIDLNTAVIETNRSNFYVFFPNQTSAIYDDGVHVSFHGLFASSKGVHCTDPGSQILLTRNDLSRSGRGPSGNSVEPTALFSMNEATTTLDLFAGASLILFGNRLSPGMVLAYTILGISVTIDPLPPPQPANVDRSTYVPRYGLANGGSGVFHQLLLVVSASPQQEWALLPLSNALHWMTGTTHTARSSSLLTTSFLRPYFQSPNSYAETIGDAYWLSCLNTRRDDTQTPVGSAAEAAIATSPSGLLQYRSMSPADGAVWLQLMGNGMHTSTNVNTYPLWCRDTQTVSLSVPNPSSSPSVAISDSRRDASETSSIRDTHTQPNNSPTHTAQPRRTATDRSTKSASLTHTLPLPVEPPQSTDAVPPAVGATIAITAGVVAADLQAQGVLQLSACSQAKSRAAPGAYRTLSPAALSDTCSGVLAGQGLLIVLAAALSALMVSGIVLIRRDRRPDAVSQTCATLRCPGLALAIAAMVLNGLLVCGAELAGGGVGVPALLAAAVIPAAFPLLSWAFGTREYHLLPPLAAGPGAGWAKRWLCAALAVAMPRGDWGEEPARTTWARALSSVVGPWRLSHPLWSLTPFAGVAALVPVVAASGAGCTPLHGLSAALHGAAAIAVVVVRPRRVPLADVLHGLSLAVNGGIVAATAVQLRASEEGTTNAPTSGANNAAADPTTAGALLLLARVQVALTIARIAAIVLALLYARLYRWATTAATKGTELAEDDNCNNGMMDTAVPLLRIPSSLHEEGDDRDTSGNTASGRRQSNREMLSTSKQPQQQQQERGKPHEPPQTLSSSNAATTAARACVSIAMIAASAATDGDFDGGGPPSASSPPPPPRATSASTTNGGLSLSSGTNAAAATGKTVQHENTLLTTGNTPYTSTSTTTTTTTTTTSAASTIGWVFRGWWHRRQQRQHQHSNTNIDNPSLGDLCSIDTTAAPNNHNDDDRDDTCISMTRLSLEEPLLLLPQEEEAFEVCEQHDDKGRLGVERNHKKQQKDERRKGLLPPSSSDDLMDPHKKNAAAAADVTRRRSRSLSSVLSISLASFSEEEAAASTSSPLIENPIRISGSNGHHDQKLEYQLMSSSEEEAFLLAGLTSRERHQNNANKSRNDGGKHDDDDDDDCYRQEEHMNKKKQNGGWQRSLEEQRSLYVGHVSSYHQILHTSTPAMSFASNSTAAGAGTTATPTPATTTTYVGAASSVENEEVVEEKNNKKVKSTTTPPVAVAVGAARPLSPVEGDGDDGYVSFHGMRVRSKSTASAPSSRRTLQQ